MTSLKSKSRLKLGSSFKSHFLFFQVPIIAVFLAVLTIAETETPQDEVNAGNTIWGYLSNQFFHWGSLNSIDPEGFLAKLSNFSKQNEAETSDRSQFFPADEFKEELGLKAHFPVVMVPGISSSTIQSWGTSGKYKKHYRKNIWGTSDMIRMVISDKPTWMELMKLDPVTGLDPEGIKLRATEGFDAAEYIFPGYWVWSKVIKNLSAIGYDPTNMYMASYDWRLSIGLLEQRDQYFSKLKNQLENNKLTFGRRSVVLGHSMGSTIVHYFLKWVESPEGGNGGDRWVEDHIENVVHIGGALLGVPKALTFLLTGENRDVLSMKKLTRSFAEKFFCRGERVDLIRNWGGSAAMITKGGNAIWGDNNGAPDDLDTVNSAHSSHGNYLSFLPEQPKDINNGSSTPATNQKKRQSKKHKVDANINSTELGNGTDNSTSIDGTASVKGSANHEGSISDKRITNHGNNISDRWSTIYDVITTDDKSTKHDHNINQDDSANHDGSISDTGSANQDSNTEDVGNATDDDSTNKGNSADGDKTPDTNGGSSDDGDTGKDNNNLENVISVDHLPPLLNHTMDMTLALLQSRASPEFVKLLHNNYSYGISTSKSQLKKNDDDPSKWSNPLESRLPYAPTTKFYCLYGVGATTERSYYLVSHDPTQPLSENDKVCKAHGNVPNAAGGTTAIPLYINTAINTSDDDVQLGIRMTDGDQTVPVLSNGYMCAPSGGWTKHADLYNPGKSPVVAREYEDKYTKGPSKNRGAPTAAKHVEILGNEELLLDVILLVSNRGDMVGDRLHSSIETFARRISLTHYK